MIKKIIFLILFIFISTSCGTMHFTSGKPFDIESVNGIVKGITTMENIVKIFGEPQMSGRDSDGLDSWTYFYIEAEVPLKGKVAKEKFRRLSFTFKDEKVKSFSYEISQ